MEQLINDLKLQIKEALNLEELSIEDFDENAPLFGEEGIGLDSIDVLEIIVLLEKNYGIRLANPKEGKAIFHSIRTIAEYVQANRKK
jgi:acyl carrier protein